MVASTGLWRVHPYAVLKSEKMRLDIFNGFNLNSSNRKGACPLRMEVNPDISTEYTGSGKIKKDEEFSL